MSKAHANSVLALKGVPVPLDNNAYAHWNFEQNLVSGINPLIPIVKYQNVYSNPNTKADIMTTGKFGNGIGIDEAATNLLTAPTFIGQTGLASCFTTYGSPIQEIVATSYIAGTNSQRLAYDTSTNDGVMMNKGVLLSKAVTSGQTYTLSFYGKGWEERSAISFYSTTTSGVEITKVTLSDGWKRYIYKFTASAATIYIHIRPNNNTNYNFDCLINAPQLELQSYATAFVSGQRYQTNLKYPLSYGSNNIRTISFWFKSNSNKNLASIPRVLMSQTEASGELAASPFWYCAIPSTGDVLMATDGAPGLRLYNGTNYTCQSTTNVLDDKWHFIVIELNVPTTGGYLSRIWIDGFKSETVVYTDPIVGTDKNLKIGYMGDENTTTEFSNCAYDEISVRTAHYIEDELISWYLSGEPFYAPYDYTFTV